MRAGPTGSPESPPNPEAPTNSPDDERLAEAEPDRQSASRSRQRASHRTILRGTVVALVLCEIAGRAGAAPTLAGGGASGILALPFFAPSLLGVFASQLLRRPIRLELLATIALAAVLAWPVYGFVAAHEFAAMIAACSALGAAGLLVLVASAAAARGRERDEVLDVLLPALILPSFVVLAHPMVFLTSALWPTTFDHRLYLADAAFGAPLSFVVGRATAAVPLLPAICMAVYVGLPLALMLVHTLRAMRRVRSGDALVAFVAVTVVGYFGYLAAPVAGPVYAFGDLFPLHPPDPSTLGSAKSLVQPMPRNCMPSLHSAWALLVWWNARPLARGPRAAAAVFLAITLLATVGLGFHYVVDLVAAFPLTMAAQAWATRVTNEPRRRFAIGAGLMTTVGWMALVTWSDVMLQWPAVACWLLASAIVAASWLLESRVYASRCETFAESVVARGPSSWMDRGASLTLVLVGMAAFLSWAIAANALILVFGATAQARPVMLAVLLAGSAMGMAVGGWHATATGRPLRAAAISAAGIALANWLSPPMLSWIGDAFPGVAGPITDGSGRRIAAVAALSMPALLPAAILAGSAAACLTRHLGSAGRSPTHAAALGFALPLIGAALGSLATGYLILPSLRSSAAPAIVAAAAAMIAAALSSRRAAAVAAFPSSADTASRVANDAPAADDEGSTRAADGRRHAVSDRFAATVSLAVSATIAAIVATVCVHLLAVVAGDTVYSRAQAPFLVCLGLGSGALLTRRIADDDEAGGLALVLALTAFAVTVGIGISLWSEVPGYFGSFRAYAEQHKVTTSFAEREFVRLCAGALLLMAPMLCAGALLTAGAGRIGIGRIGEARIGNPAAALASAMAIAVPAVVLGVLITAAWLVPAFGSRLTLEGAAWLAVLLAGVSLRRCNAVMRKTGGAAIAIAAVILLVAAHPFDLSRLASGSGLSFQPESAGATVDSADRIGGLVSVHDTVPRALRRLVVNGRTRAQRRSGDDAAVATELAGLLRAGARGHALAIGLGTGAPLRILRDAGFAHVTVAEPNSAVVAMATAQFASILDGAVDDERTSIVALDGRSVLAGSGPAFDLIVVEAVDITDPDAARLYTREFYETAAARLTSGGVLQQDLALGHFSAMAVTSVVASARRTFEQVRIAFLGDRATIVACPDRCDRPADATRGAIEKDTLMGIGRANGLDLVTLDGVAMERAMLEEGGRLDPAAVDRMLESSAEQLGVSVDALGSTDLDMFLPYHAPRSLLEPYDAAPASLALLRRFSSAPATAPPADR